MISKYILPLISVMVVFLVVAVPYSSAAGNEIVEHNIELSVDSANNDRYDQVVNVADPSTAITNINTWTPSPRGIWLGASTEESLFQFSEIMYETNSFNLFHEVQFNSTQIMNGASVTVLRSPIHIEGIESLELSIWNYDDPGVNWTINNIGTDYLLSMESRALIYQKNVDMTDVSITGGENTWIVNDRLYIEMHAPIFSGTKYILHWNVNYKADASPAIYISSQDIANDNLVLTRIGMYNQVFPDHPATKEYTWAIDPGVSYDMITGLGNELYAESFYVHAGDSITYKFPAPGRPESRDYYHTLMMPFVTDDGTLSASVKYQYNGIRDDAVIWQSAQTEWQDYILACSPTMLGIIESGRSCKINITFLEDTRINLMFLAGRDADHTDLSLLGNNHEIWARPWISYQLSLGQVQPPSINPTDWPGLAEVQDNDQANYFGSLIGVALIVVGAALIPIGVGIPILIGGAAIAAGVSLLILDEIAHNKGYSGVGEYLGGMFSNAIDNLWEGLQGVGNFLWAIGEAIYDGLVWFADAVTEYGSVLLGLLIIGVALALFFVPIYTQIKLWGIFLAFSEGKVDKATSMAQDLASHGSAAVGKIKGLI